MGLDTSAVGAYLASHVAIVLCAEVEAQVTAFFDELIDAAECNPTVTRLAKLRKGTTRSAKVKDIGDAIERLGSAARERYDAAINDTVGEAGIARIGTTVGARDSASHRTTALAITFADLELAAQAAVNILQSVRTALQLP